MLNKQVTKQQALELLRAQIATVNQILSTNIPSALDPLTMEDIINDTYYVSGFLQSCESKIRTLLESKLAETDLVTFVDGGTLVIGKRMAD